MRVISHPVLEDMQGAKWVEITVDGRKIVARQGESIAAALMAEGIRTMRYTPVKSEPRGVFCGIGQCSDCMVTVNDVPNIRACITRVEEGMVVETGTVQHRG